MKQLSDAQLLLFRLGAVAMLLGAALFIMLPRAAAVTFAIGALLFTPMQLLQRYEGRDFVVRRLRRQQILGAMALLVTATMMLMQAYNAPWCGRNEWVVALAVACVLELYTAFRIPVALRRADD